MQIFDQRIYDIVDKSLEGAGLTETETCELFAVPETSKEAALIRWAGQELSLRAANGVAEIHAQIGLNSTTCPMNCKFCSFAACNNGRKVHIELERDDVLRYAELAMKSGANALLLLCTATYKFEKLAEMAREVREVIPDDMPLLVNSGDMTLDQALMLRAAGVNGAYHAVRMREGVDTGIPVEKRLATLQNLIDANMSISTCVEPIGPEHTPEELTQAVFRCNSYNPVSGGAGRRVGVPGTLLFDRGMVTEVYNANAAAIYRMAVGTGMRLNCSANTVMTAASGANLAWTEVGANPRDLVALTEEGGRAASIEFCRKNFAGAGWEILDGPSQGWML